MIIMINSSSSSSSSSSSTINIIDVAVGQALDEGHQVVGRARGPVGVEDLEGALKNTIL